MDHFVYIAAAGAKESMLAQAANAHNLANASTVGFKADLVEAETVYLRGAGQETRAYNVIQGTGTDFEQGVIEQTGRDLDLAINGEGWFAVQALTGEGNGGEGVTRRGDFRIDEFGQLVNGAGQALLGNDGPIALPPFSSLSIGSDGTVSIVPLGELPNAVAVLDRIKMVNPASEDLSKGEDGFFRTDSDLPTPADGNVRLVSGALESSNVNPVTAMVRMIELSRQFEHYVKLMKTAEDVDTSSASLMRLQS
ncbi:flagellar basal-body rod protein FlgF [Congregibacter litoralis]|uniref:Flagellar basal-body rod protein FlgF n=1 Tax=Congregibacter litoralis KT71 TaxID=314285 RepID=A4A614_9GAMM|nr:flagellar basal-body rod protein FlgF [Congregibacter litoralis]EAQ98461.1 flagellar basal-body rod protein FlgF [Congregibacter litoralis KT71]